MRMQAQTGKTNKDRSGHHGKEQRKDDDSRKRGRQHVTQAEQARMRGEQGEGHS
ncbi:MAG TPA: hypothetical protein VGJ04_07475 [Pirellulales bacterium]